MGFPETGRNLFLLGLAKVGEHKVGCLVSIYHTDGILQEFLPVG